MDFPVLYKEKSECCGCTACYSVCPKGAISMIPDNEGFEYPKVDTDKCINVIFAFEFVRLKKKYKG